jgi:16S rRNA (cytosine1402-N4)-methyltransferase
MSEELHIPVMAEEASSLLVANRNGFFVDGTVGMGGHAEAILRRGGERLSLLGIDRDPAAIEIAGRRLAPFAERVRLVRGNFRDLARLAAGRPADGVLLDLGVSSFQLADAARGFSYMIDGPLDMAMGPDGRSVREFLATAEERDVGRIIREYGEERRSRAIAREIVRRRARQELSTTAALRDCVAAAAPARDRFGTLSRVFQALRIWANGELEHLEAALPEALSALVPGGRIVVISYHSLEDRIVKRFFRREERGCVCPADFPQCRCGRAPRLRLLARGALRPSPEEIERNARSRSARLRAGERVSHELV